MENDVLRNKIAPWQEKGRWYHGVWDRTLNKVVPEYTDKYLIDNLGHSESGSTIFMYDKTNNIEFIDAKSIIFSDYSCVTSISSTIGGKRYYNSGEIGIGVLGGTGVKGKFEFWLFGVERNK